MKLKRSPEIVSDIDIHQKQDMQGVERQWDQFQQENDISKIEKTN